MYGFETVNQQQHRASSPLAALKAMMGVLHSSRIRGGFGSGRRLGLIPFRWPDGVDPTPSNIETWSLEDIEKALEIIFDLNVIFKDARLIHSERQLYELLENRRVEVAGAIGAIKATVATDVFRYRNLREDAITLFWYRQDGDNSVWDYTLEGGWGNDEGFKLDTNNVAHLLEVLSSATFRPEAAL